MVRIADFTTTQIVIGIIIAVILIALWKKKGKGELTKRSAGLAREPRFLVNNGKYRFNELHIEDGGNVVMDMVNVANGKTRSMELNLERNLRIMNWIEFFGGSPAEIEIFFPQKETQKPQNGIAGSMQVGRYPEHRKLQHDARYAQLNRVRDIRNTIDQMQRKANEENKERN